MVNGFQQQSFHDVSLSVRLQGPSNVEELHDARSNRLEDSGKGNPKDRSSFTDALCMNDTLDVIVKHCLVDLGTHTLRVTVSFTTIPNGEIKSLRKFYRFNVLRPLQLTSKCLPLKQLPVIQCEVQNSTKSTTLIKTLTYVTLLEGITATLLSSEIYNGSDCYQYATEDSLQLILEPNETFAFAFQLEAKDDKQRASLLCQNESPVGYPIVEWCSYMGETCVFKGETNRLKEDSKPNLSNIAGPSVANALSKNALYDKSSILHIQCLKSPAKVSLGDKFEVTIRISNMSKISIPVSLLCKNNQKDVVATHSPKDSAIDQETNHSRSKSLSIDKSETLTRWSPPGLLVVGLTLTNIGVIESGEWIDTSLIIHAMQVGLHQLKEVYVVDNVSKREFNNDPICKTLVEPVQF